MPISALQMRIIAYKFLHPDEEEKSEGKGRQRSVAGRIKRGMYSRLFDDMNILSNVACDRLVNTHTTFPGH